jgi:hypothetical protein
MPLPDGRITLTVSKPTAGGSGLPQGSLPGTTWPNKTPEQERLTQGVSSTIPPPRSALEMRSGQPRNRCHQYALSQDAWSACLS